MSYKRTDRISEEIKKEISRIIHDEVKDPSISSMASVVRAEVSGDLKYAKIYISVLGSKEDRINTIDGLKRAAGYIRKQLGRNLKIRYTPELNFISDTSIEYSVEINKKINEISQKPES